MALGRKDDSGKLDMTLLDDMPLALAAVVLVMQWAITEKQPVPYERSSWLGVHPDRYRAAIQRHNLAACAGAADTNEPARFQCDDESGSLHLAHIAVSALMALELTLREAQRQPEQKPPEDTTTVDTKAAETQYNEAIERGQRHARQLIEALPSIPTTMMHLLQAVGDLEGVPQEHKAELYARLKPLLTGAAAYHLPTAASVVNKVCTSAAVHFQGK